MDTNEKEWSVVLESSSDWTENFFVAHNGVRVAEIVTSSFYEKKEMAQSIVDKLNAYNEIIFRAKQVLDKLD
jgi:hypothetical protein